jgi:PAS domain-containing protein
LHHARSTERALDLIVGVTAVASAAEASDLALVCLNKICALRRWQFGQVWYPDASDEFLKCSGDSRHGHQQFAEFHEISRSMPLRRGDDLPSCVWKTKAPIWLADLVEYGNLPRAEAARLQSFKTAFAFPIILDNEVLAVFEFSSTGRHLTDRTSVDAFHKHGKFLGDVFVRKRTQTELRTSEERWRSLLDRPIFGVTFFDENQRFISSNQAYRGSSSRRLGRPKIIQKAGA